MADYAILGGTGQIGRSILRLLLERSQVQPDTAAKQQIHVFVRSRTRLEKQLKTPEFASLDQSPIRTFHSEDVSDIDTLVECIRGTNAAFLCVAVPNNRPGCTIAQEQNNAVISALRQIEKENTQRRKLPRLIMISSAEAEEIRHLSRNIPWPVYRFLFTANSHAYRDLIAAEKILRQESDWIDFVVVKPGGLSWDVAKGHKLSCEEQQTFISFADLAGGMVEAADEESDQYRGRSVSVLVPSGGVKPAYASASILLRGFLVHFFPRMYGWLF